MPQAPIAGVVAQNPSNALVPLKVGAAGSLLTAEGLNAALNVTSAAVIKTGAGRVNRLIIVAAPSSSGAITLNDAATTGAAATSNEIWSIPYNGTAVNAGAVINLDVPFTNGLVISAVGGGSPQYTITYT